MAKSHLIALLSQELSALLFAATAPQYAHPLPEDVLKQRITKYKEACL